MYLVPFYKKMVYVIKTIILRTFDIYLLTSTKTDDRKETTSHTNLEEETTSNDKNDSSTQEQTTPVGNGHTNNTNGVIMNDTSLGIFVTYCFICILFFCVLLWKSKKGKTLKI